MNQRTRDEIVSLFLAGTMPRKIEGLLGLTGQRQKIYETIEAARRSGMIPRRGIWGRPKRSASLQRIPVHGGART